MRCVGMDRVTTQSVVTSKTERRYQEGVDMARTRYKFLKGDCFPYFLTATTVNWLPLFRDPDIANIVIASLAFLQREKRLILYAYVLMENHIHLIASAENLSKETANFKSFTARQSIDHYSE